MAPESYTGAEMERGGDRAALNCPGLLLSTRAAHPLVMQPGEPSSFPDLPPKEFPGGVQDGATSAPVVSLFPDGADHQTAAVTAAVAEERKKEGVCDLSGLKLFELGPVIHQELLGVVSLRSSSMGERKSKDLFPLPTSKSFLGEICPQLSDSSLGWMMAICTALNSMWGGTLQYEGPISNVAQECLQLLSHDVERMQRMEGSVESFSWTEFFNTRSIDYKGDEVRTARILAQHSPRRSGGFG